MRRAVRVAAWILLALIVVAAAYAGNVAIGMREIARTSGTISGLGVWQPVTILRDGRDVPHIAAHNEHDAFFAEGFAEGSDRLFQMDLTRRFVEGRLAEILGRPALQSDERERTLPVEQLAQMQWERLPARSQNDLQAFADGVNAAMRTQPLPPEFRMLLYQPQPWRPQDSLVASFGIVLDLADLWTDIAKRAVSPSLYDRLHPLTDPCYDAPVTDGLTRISASPNCVPSIAGLAIPPSAGSNEWAAGAGHTTTGRALLANDPHLRLGIPGAWYLVDLRFPGYHAAGATLAGLPGVILGHNDRIAWAATNGTVASLSVFDAPANLDRGSWVTETFGVRFGLPAHARYYRGTREFGAVLAGGRLVLVRWDAYADPTSQLSTFDGLDRAHSIEDASQALRAYPGPTQNFVLADTAGRVAYQLAGRIPDDPAWARSIHPSRDLARTYANVPFERLPRVAPSRDAIVWSANNKMYGPEYPYRLSPEFAPPYRAYRIAQLLKARSRYDVGHFAQMQMDTLSLPEHDLARMVLCDVRDPYGARMQRRFPVPVALLARWDGRFASDSRAGTIAYRARVRLTARGNQRVLPLMIQARRIECRTQYPGLPIDFAVGPGMPVQGAIVEPWGVAGAVTPLHPLAAMGITFLNGTTFPGDGDAFTIHVQSPTLSQSFRAIWDVGNWDAGGISLPQGESGEPGSGHYTDEAADWIAGRLLALPYSRNAVEAAARERLTLVP
ncbi:MAG TPA: penicillin acylase family protein [Candidatus Tyrphobacter sp.]